MNKVKVAIADDHKLFRKGVLSMLAGYEQIAEVKEAENGSELLELIDKFKPDVVLVDLNMPVMSGWLVLSELKKKRKSNVGIIILSMYEEEDMVINAIKSGAGAFLSKNADPEEIILAIESVALTGYYFN